MMQAINQPTDIDLTRHAVIEASAGTGKTYTITHLVRRLLLEQKLPITKIILVTFTDKATSELKTRIHEMLVSELKNHQEQSAEWTLLAVALRDVQQASIFTIHGFCQRVLKEYAFEQGAVLDKALVDDHQVILSELHALKRTWPALENITDRLVYADLTMAKLDKLLTDLAKNMQSGDEVIPDVSGLAFDAAQKQLADYGPVDNQSIEQALQALPGLSGRKKPHRLKKLYAALNILDEITGRKIDVKWLMKNQKNLVDNIEGLLSTEELAEVQEASESPENDAFLSWFDGALRIKDAVVKAFHSVKYELVVNQLISLKERIQKHKKSRGLISYNDMIADLSSVLQQEAAAADPQDRPLTQQLRQRYRVALIDEFQDTDEHQWHIFRTVFVAQGVAQRLVLIGDPKQSIYAFRGANIHTYEAAKATLIDTHEGLGYRLSTNYRAIPALTQSLNRFFSEPADDMPAWYAPAAVVVDSPSEQQRSDNGGPLLLTDHSGTEALNLVQATGDGLLVGALREQLANRMAAVIKNNLLGRLHFKVKNSEKILTAGDVCVLVRTKADAIPIEAALDRLQIPHTFYKKNKLYQSEAAIQLQVMLTALAFPDQRRHVNNAWLGLFFRLSAEQIQSLNDHQNLLETRDSEGVEQAMHIWLRLKVQAAQRDWVGVFLTLMEDAGTTDRLYQAGSWRLLSNLKQIIQELVKVAIQQQLDAHGLLHQLLDWRNSKSISEDDLQQKDTERPAVQIMTVHSSKGLEFPVVFLFGAHSESRAADYYQYHNPSNRRQVFDLARSNKALFEAENLAENQRLHYVAMTRAVFKLFVSAYPPEVSNENKSFYQQEVIPRLFSHFNELAFNELGGQHEWSVTGPVIEDPATSIKPARDLSMAAVDLPDNLYQRSRQIHSFSSLQRRSQAIPGQVSDLQSMAKAQRDDLATDLSPIWPATTPDKPTIPGGAQTGNVLHGIFENIPFAIAKACDEFNEFNNNQEVMAVIESQMQSFLMNNTELKDEQGRVVSNYQQELARWVWHTLRKPLAALNGLRLCELEPADKRHEMSFFWAHDRQVLTGFIDLLFKVPGDGGKYYILDWKSSLSPQGYAPATLASEVMATHNYHDQYRWYTLAVKTWFAGLGLPAAHLAGALYLFSRGIDSEANDQDGIFYQDLSTGEFEIEPLRRALHEQINQSHTTGERSR